MKKNNLLFFKTIKTFFLTLFLFFLPTQLAKHFFFNFSYAYGVKVDYLSITFYLTDIIFLILAVFHFKVIVDEVKKNKFALLTIFILFLLQSFLAQYKLLYFYHLFKIVEIYFVFLIFKNVKQDLLILLSFLFGCLFQLILAMSQLYAKSSLQGFFYFFGERYITLSSPDIAKTALNGVEFLRPYGTFSHPNSLAGFYLLLYFYFLTNKNFERFKILKYLSLLIFTLLVFISFSKTAIVTFVILNLLYSILYIKSLCRICIISRILTIIALALIFLQVRSDPLSFQKRLNLFYNGLNILKNNLFFGVGLGHYLLFQAKIPTPYPYFFLQPVHNIFILFLSETGIILGGVIFYFLYKSFKLYLKQPVFLFCFLVILITGLFDHYWLTLQQNWLLLGVVLGLIRQNRMTENSDAEIFPKPLEKPVKIFEEKIKELETANNLVLRFLNVDELLSSFKMSKFPVEPSAETILYQGTFKEFINEGKKDWGEQMYSLTNWKASSTQNEFYSNLVEKFSTYIKEAKNKLPKEKRLDANARKTYALKKFNDLIRYQGEEDDDFLFKIKFPSCYYFVLHDKNNLEKDYADNLPSEEVEEDKKRYQDSLQELTDSFNFSHLSEENKQILLNFINDKDSLFKDENALRKILEVFSDFLSINKPYNCIAFLRKKYFIHKSPYGFKHWGMIEQESLKNSLLGVLITLPAKTFQEEIIKNLEKITKEHHENKIPIYDRKGNLIWPKE